MEVEAGPTSQQALGHGNKGPARYNAGFFQRLAVGRKVMVSAWIALGLVPAAARSGDKICQFRGSECLYVIREISEGQYVLVGQVCKLNIAIYLECKLTSLDFLCRVTASVVEKYAYVGMINLV